MAMVALVGTPGAPGVTTTALALLLTWPLPAGRRVLLAECDPDGGAVLPGALQGRVDGAWGLRHLAVADRRGLLAASVWEQLVDLSPGGSADRLLLPGVTDPAQTPGLAYTWDPLARLFAGWHGAAGQPPEQGLDVLADLGRGGAAGGPAALARRADAVLVVVRGTLRGVSGAQPRLAALREDLRARGSGADTLGVVLVEQGPYGAAEVQRHLGVPVVGTLPFAPGHARVLSDGDGESSDRRFVRSELMRSARSLADGVQARAAERRRRLEAPYREETAVAGGEGTDREVSAVPSGPPAAGTPAAGYGPWGDTAPDAWPAGGGGSVGGGNGSVAPGNGSAGAGSAGSGVPGQAPPSPYGYPSSPSPYGYGYGYPSPPAPRPPMPAAAPTPAPAPAAFRTPSGGTSGQGVAHHAR